jgi:hypothetical protein
VCAHAAAAAGASGSAWAQAAAASDPGGACNGQQGRASELACIAPAAHSCPDFALASMQNFLHSPVPAIKSPRGVRMGMGPRNSFTKQQPAKKSPRVGPHDHCQPQVCFKRIAGQRRVDVHLGHLYGNCTGLSITTAPSRRLSAANTHQGQQ